MSKNAYREMSREDLLKAVEMFAKSWLAHDGCWFLAAEEKLGLDGAMDLDARSWERFAAAEAQRIATTFGLGEGSPLERLERALSLRMYGVLNDQHTEWSDDGKRLRFLMDTCRVQETRHRKGLPDFPCKNVGIVEFSTFARAVDGRIRTECLRCPPDAPGAPYCGWEFWVEES